MKFSAAVVLAAAAGASAWKSNVTYTTEVVTAYTTYCPAPTEITHGGKTYTVTEATTLTITNCPCTITKPITTTSSVICHTCTSYQNSTSAVVVVPTTTPVGTGSVPTTTKGPAPTTSLATAGAGKAAALSGGALAGVLGLAAFVL
jgi:hypothetical protein